MKITKLIDSAIELENEKKQESRTPRKPDVFWPSSASVVFTNEYGEQEVHGKCLRSEYWSCKGEKTTNKTTAYSLRIWSGGNRVEDFEIKGAKTAGIHVDDDVPFEHVLPNGNKVRGKLDAIYNVQSEDVGIEYKTGYGNWFKRLQMGIGSNNTKLKITKYFKPAPKEANVLQVMLYLDHFKERLKRFFLIYLDRGDGSNHEFEMTLDTEGYPVIDGEVDKKYSVQNIYTRFDELKLYLDSDQVPPPDFEAMMSDERVEELHAAKRLSKKAYDGHQRWKNDEQGGRRASYFMCGGYCPYELKCKALIREELKETGTYEKVTGEQPDA